MELTRKQLLARLAYMESECGGYDNFMGAMEPMTYAKLKMDGLKGYIDMDYAELADEYREWVEFLGDEGGHLPEEWAKIDEDWSSWGSLKGE